jgi:hypothetical protein
MHIARICGVNKNDEPVPDIWVDVLRIDRIKINTQEALHLKKSFTQNQEVTIKLKWKDDEGRQEEFEDGDGRKVVIVKVCSPDEDNPEDPEEWVPIPAIKNVFLAQSYKGTNRNFFNSILADKNRTKVEIRKFSHYDTSIDDKAEAAFENGDTVFVVPVDEYEFMDDSKDEANYLEHEVVLKSNLNMTPHWEESLGGGLKSTFTFKNQFLIKGSDEAEQGVAGGEINPPWRLDPFQNIVNCQFAPRVYVVIVGAGEHATAGKEGVSILDTRSVASPTSSLNKTGTLIECSAAAGEGFASIHTPIIGGPGGEGGGEGSALMQIIVYPKVDDVLSDWWEWAKHWDGVDTEPDDSLGPYLWVAGVRAYGPSTYDFKIKYKPHLNPPGPHATKNTMVQAFPTTGAHSGLGGIGEPMFVTGYFIYEYRLDKKGEGTLYVPPPSWRPDETTVGPGGAYATGLNFPKEPPLIDSDTESTGIAE